MANMISVNCVISAEIFDFVEEKTVELRDTQSLQKLAFSIAHEALFDECNNVIEDALASYVFDPAGGYSLKALASELYSKAKEYVDNFAGAEKVVITEMETKVTTLVGLSDVMKRILDDRAENDSYYWDIGKVIEKSFDEGDWQWQYGFLRKDGKLCEKGVFPSSVLKEGMVTSKEGNDVLIPVLWYGNSASCRAPWIISSQITEDEYSFWFENEAWNIMKQIITDCEYTESDDIFLTWYLCEIGLGVPDLEPIRKSCPIELGENDTIDDLTRKINTFFEERYGAK